MIYPPRPLDPADQDLIFYLTSHSPSSTIIHHITAISVHSDLSLSQTFIQIITSTTTQLIWPAAKTRQPRTTHDKPLGWNGWVSQRRLFPPGRRTIVCGPNIYRPTQRTVLDTETIRIYGWPSRGGVIILSGASRADFDYLGWDILDLSRKRNPDQDAEDEHCKKLLLLGATWYDSEARYKLLAAAAVNHRPTREMFENKEVPAVTMKEGLCIRVGWPRTGGLWVVEYIDSGFDEVVDEYAEEYGPGYVEGVGLVSLARDMDERCEIIERIGGKFFACLEDYDGYACLKAWEEKTTGEVGRLVQTRYVDW